MVLLPYAVSDEPNIHCNCLVPPCCKLYILYISTCINLCILTQSTYYDTHKYVQKGLCMPVLRSMNHNSL